MAKDYKRFFWNKSTKDDVGWIFFNDKTNWLWFDTSSSESDTSSSESISDKIIDSIPFMSKEKKEELKQKVPDVSIDFDTLAVTSSAFYERMPTLFTKNNMDRFLEFLNNWITDMNNIPIRKK